jgi:hypothetical protein
MDGCFVQLVRNTSLEGSSIQLVLFSHEMASSSEPIELRMPENGEIRGMIPPHDIRSRALLSSTPLLQHPRTFVRSAHSITNRDN